MGVIAHIAHWYESLLYALPMVVIGGVLWYTARKERGREAEGEAGWDGEDDSRWDDEPRLKDD